MEAPNKVLGRGRSSSGVLTKRGEFPRLAHTRGRAVATCQRRHKKANPPVKFPIASLCAPLCGLRACTTVGALWGLHGDCGSYVCSSDSSCTAASCLPPPEEEEAECGGVLPRKHTQGPGFDLSQAPPTSRVCLSAFKPAYSSPHTLAVPKLNAISPHFAASKPPACRTQPPV